MLGLSSRPCACLPNQAFLTTLFFSIEIISFIYFVFLYLPLEYKLHKSHFIPNLPIAVSPAPWTVPSWESHSEYLLNLWLNKTSLPWRISQFYHVPDRFSGQRGDQVRASSQSGLQACSLGGPASALRLLGGGIWTNQDCQEVERETSLEEKTGQGYF